MNKPPFDPNQPFESSAKPAFDPNQPFTVGDQPQAAPQADPLTTIGQVALQGAKSAITAPIDATKAMLQNPDKLGDYLPAAGAVAGSVLAPGLGSAIGAGLGQIGKRMSDLAFGKADPADAMNPAKEAIAPMEQVATGVLDLPQVQGAISTTAKAIGRGASRFGEALSGVSAQDIQQLFQKPGTLFKLGSKADAGAAIGEAKAAAGVNPGVTSNVTTLTPDNVSKALNVKGTGEQALNSVVAGDRTPEQIGDALRYISDEIKGRLAQGRDASELINVQGHLNDMLGKVAPDIQAARQNFAPLAQRNKFLQLAPRNKNQTVSKANLFYLTSLMGGLGGTLGGSKGAAEAIALGALARAPITTGLVTSGIGGASKVLENDALRKAAYASFLSKTLPGEDSHSDLESQGITVSTPSQSDSGATIGERNPGQRKY